MTVNEDAQSDLWETRMMKHANRFAQAASRIIAVFENRELAWMSEEDVEEKNGGYPLAA